jgi:colicin import membrane protein
VAPPAPDVDIALEQEKKRKLLQQQKEAEAQKVLKAEKAAEKLKAELQAKKEKEKEKEKAQQAKEELVKRKAAEEAKKQETKDLEKQQQAAEQRRKAAISRMMGEAGATGDANAKGSAQKSSGPSASYGGKVRAAVKPNVVFTDDIAGNPKAEIEVRTTLDGTIISQRLVKSSGNKAWDDAAIKGVIRTGTLPRDVDGRVPTPMTLIMSPKD